MILPDLIEMSGKPYLTLLALYGRALLKRVKNTLFFTFLQKLLIIITLKESFSLFNIISSLFQFISVLKKPSDTSSSTKKYLLFFLYLENFFLYSGSFCHHFNSFRVVKKPFDTSSSTKKYLLFFLYLFCMGELYLKELKTLFFSLFF